MKSSFIAFTLIALLGNVAWAIYLFGNKDAIADPESPEHRIYKIGDRVSRASLAIVAVAYLYLKVAGEI